MPSPLNVDEASLRALDALCARIAAAQPLGQVEARELNRAFNRAVTERMFSGGMLFAEAYGAMPHLARPDALEWIKAHDNDLAAQVAIVDRALTFWWGHGEAVAPHYPNRICIILRKAGELDREGWFTTAWCEHFGTMPHRRKST